MVEQWLSTNFESSRPDKEEEKEPATFKELIYTCAIEAMKRILGPSGTVATAYHLKLDEKTFDPENFHSKLAQMFHEGAESIEKVVVAEIYTALRMDIHDRPGYDFVKYIELARKTYENRKLSGI